MKTICTGLFVLACAAQPSAAQTGGRLVVLNKDDATLVTIDAASGRILGTVATGEGPHEVAVSDDGRWAFAANYGERTPGSSISMIDLAAMKESRRIDVTPLRRPHGLVFLDGRLYFTSETNRLIGRYDPQADKIDWLMGTGQTGTHMLWVSADGARIVTCNIGSNSMTLLERAAANPLNWSTTTIAVGKGPEGFDVSPDGREVWAAHSGDGGVSIIDLAARKVTATIDAGTKRSNRLKFTRDGRHALISDVDSGDLVVIDVATRSIARRLPVGRNPEGILIAPDGATAFVAVAGDNNIAVVDLNTWTVARRIEPGRGPDGMAFVPSR
ncbi:MAG TPA: cytochrome D1 domain-containing protein [Vicinamibacterales bacterium]|jgi:YVTN family beta-propeller protein|nr:cytochrome D1 domain-containing protein [Vicinamibacterales bacterium]